MAKFSSFTNKHFTKLPNLQLSTVYKFVTGVDLENAHSDNLKLWWTTGQRICIDESMILYKGRAVPFIQFMPAKPIKHGIKVFPLCCAVTGFLLLFEVYTGAENSSYTSNWDLIEKLIVSAGLAAAYGRILYTGE